MASPSARPTQDDWNPHFDTYAESAALNPTQAYRPRLIFERSNFGQGAARVFRVVRGSHRGEPPTILSVPAPVVSSLRGSRSDAPAVHR